MDRQICARGCVETFELDIPTNKQDKHYIRQISTCTRCGQCRQQQKAVVYKEPVVYKAPVEKTTRYTSLSSYEPLPNGQKAQQHSFNLPLGGAAQATADTLSQAPKPPMQITPKKPSERVVLKFGKISVQIKNSANVKVKEEDGGITINCKV